MAGSAQYVLRVPADRDARQRAEKVFKMALDSFIAAVAQSVGHVPERVGSLKSQATTNGRGRGGS